MLVWRRTPRVLLCVCAGSVVLSSLSAQDWGNLHLNKGLVPRGTGLSDSLPDDLPRNGRGHLGAKWGHQSGVKRTGDAENVELVGTWPFGPAQAEVLYQRRLAETGIEQQYLDAKAADQAASAAASAATAATDAFVAGHSETHGLPTVRPKGTPELGAPQAGALESAIKIVQGGDVPLGKYLAGALLGLVVSLLVSPGMGVMVGLSMYLPFEYMIVFGIGGILNILVSRWRGARFAEDKGVPIAAGLIVGDALVGVVHAVVKVSYSFA